ncbi:bifunctional adenosylcobinamide kinase/adenosylcobinamide-phosphate guanylyltransferase [Loktanella sp. TSTF-M6]|uniref:Bifunctional adenosylcobalamin biosynthesis protein n=1 Tax=Loktanella gaetbuli TaxID=2881335 RepID=A0ABS8BXB6_9RHOB|nr:bifunctional adenosylcobinamide kinase/adenosylcobinamide-phosphate guanylyltransferase [Loktanella gaetbuli]MCB5200392.1 bifunctional adenosylcobinamide kinase/adenosylcobinamide-phosphate guanylyltransferase [Loktanella gaetbuli]
MKKLAKVTFVLGGANSGKSAYAEALLPKTGISRVYVATAQAFDDEMRAKIAAHRLQRGPDWTTIEAPMDAPQVLRRQSPDAVVLLDCVTLWLTNVILAEADVDRACADLLDAIAACPCPVVVVSNEVGMGIVPDNALSRRFRAAQGRLNRDLAAQADQVVAVMAGLPLVLKAAP